MAHKGIAYAGLGKFDEADSIATELLRSIENSILKFDKARYYVLMGRMEYLKKNYNAAIDYLNQSVASTIPTDHLIGVCFDILGDIFIETGRLNLAQKEFEKIISLTSARKFNGDIASPAHYKLAQVYEQKGWEGKAIDQYKKFIELWKDCDPELRPMVEDAKSRIAIMKQTK
jgi:tetratricopeptide (TPR) repeat protein